MDLKRLSIELSKKALEIYKDLPKHEKSKWVSDAIIEKNQRESNQFYITQEEYTILKNQYEELEKRVKELEGKQCM